MWLFSLTAPDASCKVVPSWSSTDGCALEGPTAASQPAAHTSPLLCGFCIIDMFGAFGRTKTAAGFCFFFLPSPSGPAQVVSIIAGLEAVFLESPVSPLFSLF